MSEAEFYAQPKQVFAIIDNRPPVDQAKPLVPTQGTLFFLTSVQKSDLVHIRKQKNANKSYKKNVPTFDRFA